MAREKVMDFAADFTAIDFETANRRPDSACQLAAVTVRNGEIVDQTMWMIRPEPFYFSRANIEIHGITPQTVQAESVFGDLWPEIADKLGDDCVVAHNASFDIGVLLGCLRAHQQLIPDLQFTCTRAIARRTWPHHRRYGLKPLSNWLGVRFRHHDALEDSIACTKILLAAGIDQEAESLEDLEKRLRLSRGRAGTWGQRGPTSGRTRRRKQDPTPTTSPRHQSALPFLYPNQVASGQSEHRTSTHAPPTIDIQRLMIRAEFIRSLSGRQVVFTGRFRLLSQQDAEALATRLGAKCQDDVDGSTDYLVVGSHNQSARSPERKQAALHEANQERTDPQEAARRLASEGNPIKIVDEDEFLSLLISQNDPIPR
jgi:DNA polymerase-3 subunit epsilon